MATTPDWLKNNSSKNPSIETEPAEKKESRINSQDREDIVGKAYDHVLARRLVAYLRPHRGAVAVALVLMIANALLQLAGPYITKIAIDDHILAGDLQGLSRLSLLYLVVIVVGFSLQYAQFYLMQSVGQKVMLTLRVNILEHIQRQELRFFDKNPIGRLMTRVTGDVQTLQELFTSGIVTIFGDLITIVGIVIIMFLLDWRLAIVANLAIPILLAMSLYFRSKVRSTYRLTRARVAALNSFLQEHIKGMHIVQLFGREPTSAQNFAELNRAHRSVLIRTIRYYAVFFPAVELVSACAVALIIYYGGQRVLHLSMSALELGVLVAFIQYAERFFRPISDLSEKYNTLQAAMASSERIFDLLDRQPRIVSKPHARRLQQARGAIEFENVHFHYQEHEPILRGVSFSIEPGERVAIVGATGAGKTSLLSVLTRLYDIQSGRILLDGTDIRDLHLDSLRRTVGVVLQDPFLFAGDIEYNIRLGESIPMDRLREVARLVHAQTFIEKLENGYAQRINERGSMLSLGQRQLISLARVLAFDPSVLVLDEATSSIDTETEQAIQKALDQVMRNRTTLVVAHRLSTVSDSDRILVLHRGCLRESGTHKELLRLGGIYAKLYELQFRDQPSRP